ncbi:MAG: asparaginase domain-containing protein [Rhodothermales bacterium]
MKIVFITTGGTIDKIYFDAKSGYEVGDPQVIDILSESNVIFEYDVHNLFRKDSLDLTDDDRLAIREAVDTEDCDRIIVTHGTDTMVETARALLGCAGKTIVLTGSLAPARFKISDAELNLGMAIAAVQMLPNGVYITMNGTVFEASNVRKNREANRFERL